MESKEKKSGYQLAVDHFGGVDELAVALGISRQAIYMWDGQIPPARAYQIESITEGRLKAADLSPKNTKRRQQEARA